MISWERFDALPRAASGNGAMAEFAKLNSGEGPASGFRQHLTKPGVYTH